MKDAAVKDATVKDAAVMDAANKGAAVKDWVAWHREYDDPSSSLSARLDCVRRHLAAAIDQMPPGSLQVVSLCAGQGHDVIGVLSGHPRRDDVRALLVESDPRNARLAAQRAAAAGLGQVEVRQADAGYVANFADALPADLLLLCGIFGNVGEADIERTVRAAGSLCSPGGIVIWTRHRRAPDLTPRLRSWFADSGFDEVAFDALDTSKLTSVGVHRLRGEQDGRAVRPQRPASLPDGPLFTFGGA